MYFTYEEIKREIEQNWEQFQEARYPQDLLDEFADSAIPVYNHELIRDWQEMPSQFDNSWQEYGLPSTKVEEITIYGLMRIDLYNYYRDEFERAYREIYKNIEKEEENDN